MHKIIKMINVETCDPMRSDALALLLHVLAAVRTYSYVCVCVCVCDTLLGVWIDVKVFVFHECNILLRHQAKGTYARSKIRGMTEPLKKNAMKCIWWYLIRRAHDNLHSTWNASRSHRVQSDVEFMLWQDDMKFKRQTTRSHCLQ